jgi:uncharacterized repeat protein (TIGR01451 family)
LGDALSYAIHYSYTAPISATAARVTDSLPPGVTYLTSTGGLSSSYAITGHQVTWELGSVAPGQGETLTVDVQPVVPELAGQEIANSAFLVFSGYRSFSATVGAASAVVSPQLEIGYPSGTLLPDSLPLCQGDSVSLAARSNRPGPLDYAWDLGDGIQAATRVVTHSWELGAYSVALTTTNAYGWQESDGLGVAVAAAPVAQFQSNSPVVLGQNAVFTDGSTFEPSAWQWDFGDGAGRSDVPNPVYNYANPGRYTVTLTVTNRCGVDVFQEDFQVRFVTYLPLTLRNYPGAP